MGTTTQKASKMVSVSNKPLQNRGKNSPDENRGQSSSASQVAPKKVMSPLKGPGV